MQLSNVIKKPLGMMLVVALLAMFFAFLFFADNKYKTPPPYGRDGLISVNQADISYGKPLVLVSGWLLSDQQVNMHPTYIGEFSSLQRGDVNKSPHGKASYNLTIGYSGEPLEAAIYFPQLFSHHVISLDGRTLSQGLGSAKISFELTQGNHVLTVETESHHGFYSGMYHPPVMASTEALFGLVLKQCIIYGLAFFGSLALALFTLALWRRPADQTSFWFGLLCFAFAFYISYYFVRLLSLPFVESWYLVQSAALYMLCFCVVRLTGLSGGIHNEKIYTFIQRVLIGFSLILLSLALLISVFPWSVWLHGVLTDFYYIFTFCSLLFLVLLGKPQPKREYGYTLLGCTVFGSGLLLNLFASGLFEPLLFFWQFEWCGLFLVVLFGAMMAARNKRILLENEDFSTHLESLVEKRTEELTHLLQERKAFFADMAHDLKAPIFATKAFITAIRENDTGIDGELLRYIDQVEQKQQEMAQRVQSLTTINNLDSGFEPWVPMSIEALLHEAYEAHHMAAEVVSVHLVVTLPEEGGFILAQPKKMNILLENLIFNALKATPAGGSITLSAELEDEECHLAVSDTGKGISTEELPHIFRRFYVGKENYGSGSGLGLYIVKSIVDELKGEISVSSKPGQGTIFYVDIPLYTYPTPPSPNYR